MKTFLFLLKIPNEIWRHRVILSVEEKGEHLVFWTAKELDAFYSGEFSWKKLGLMGICAMQYVGLNTVRLIVRAENEEFATSMVKNHAWHIHAKKTHRKASGQHKQVKKELEVTDTVSKSQ